MQHWLSKYPEAIHEKSVPELKEAVMGPDSVATIVASADLI